MPNPPTTYMLLVLPTENADADLWDQLLNAALGGTNGIDAHDHTPGRGKLIPSAGLNINDVLVFNNQRGTQIRGLAFTPLAAPLATGIFEVHVGPDNNLYYRNAIGVNVRITNGNTLDVTSVGGIAGDYSAVGAEVAYVDASDTYTMRQQVALLVRQWARVACGGIDLFEYKAAGDPIGVSNRVRLSSPAALASSYELVMPAALPGSSSLVQLAAPTGAVAALVLSDTVPGPLNLAGGITNNVPLPAGATAGVGASITSPTFLASSDYKHSYNIEVPMHVGHAVVLPQVGAPGSSLGGTDLTQLVVGTSNTEIVLAFVALPRGFITTVQVGYTKGGAGTLTARLKRNGVTILTDTRVGVGAPGAFLFAQPAPKTWSTEDLWYLTIQGTGSSGDVIVNLSAFVDNPP